MGSGSRDDLCPECRDKFAAYGRQGGSPDPRKGGLARIAKMTPQQLAEHTQKMRDAKRPKPKTRIDAVGIPAGSRIGKASLPQSTT